jgi:alcohol dehydrogenase YqhD (iron-dependent ADH family)
VNELICFAVNHLNKEQAMKLLIPIVMLLTISGCTSTAENSTVKQSNDTNKTVAAKDEKSTPKQDLICKTEKKLGSNMKTKVCRPKS